MIARALLRLAPPLLLAALAGAPESMSAQLGSYAYFSVTPDLRLCPSPVCGGFHLQAINQPSTTCADGSQQASCYVASADFGALVTPPGYAPGGLVVRGQIAADDYPGFGNLGKLVVESAWTGATAQVAQGSLYRIRDLGIVCVTSPCFSLEARALNQTTILALSRLDLSAVGATPEQLAAAQKAVQRGALLVTGTTGPDPGPAGEGLALLASQFWLPEPARPRCLSDAECPAGASCNAAEICLPPPECEPGDPCPAVCSGYCETAAANPMCVDLQGYDFGVCATVLGWGVVGGSCVAVSGCDPGPFSLFASGEECRAACLPAHAVPALSRPAALALGLSLCALAAGWSLRSAKTGPRRDDSGA